MDDEPAGRLVGDQIVPTHGGEPRRPAPVAVHRTTQWRDGSEAAALVPRPPSPDTELCVVIPVRDEACTIDGTLDALAGQVDLRGRPLDRSRFEVIVLANNCRDDSAALARRFAGRHPSLQLHVAELALPPDSANVGGARRRLMDDAYRRLQAVGQDRGVIASTDGDSRVAPTWVAATLGEVKRGFDAVGGRIVLEPTELAALEPSVRAFYLRDVAYGCLVAGWETYLDPDLGDHRPRHHQHFGASFAVTADAYHRAGGMPAADAFEDILFYRALMRIDARFRHSPAVRVRTSARRIGRTPIGLATNLVGWAALGRAQASFVVESPSSIEARVRGRRLLRTAWRRAQHGPPQHLGDLAGLAEALGVERDRLGEEVSQSRPFGMLLELVAPDWRDGHTERDGPNHPELADVAEALAEIRIRLERARRGWADAPHVTATAVSTARPLAPLEEVQPVQLLASGVQVAQLRPRAREEQIVDLVAGQGVVQHIRRPVDQQQVSARFEAVEEACPGEGEVVPRPVVADLRQHDQVEPSVGQVFWHPHQLEADVPEATTPLRGATEGPLGDVDRQQGVATLG